MNRVVQVDPEKESAAWDRYLQPKSTTCLDLCAWAKVVQNTYPIRPHFFLSKTDDSIKALRRSMKSGIRYLGVILVSHDHSS